MRRFSSTLPVPKSMYRHFAVITLVLTSGIALMADGERRQSIRDEIETQNQQADLRQAEADKRPPGASKVKEIRYASGGWGSDGVVDTEPAVSTQGRDYSVANADGGMRIAGSADFGVMGPMPSMDIRNGRFPRSKTGPVPRPGGPDPITAAQRRAFESAIAKRAGAPTPVN